jgi:hypothetical protein
MAVYAREGGSGGYLRRFESLREGRDGRAYRER